MAGKRYYWLKLQVSFFQELIIKQLRTLPEGDSIVLLYLKLLLKAINTEGIIYYQNILPSLHEEIALDTGEKPALVKLTISALCQYHAAVFLDDQALYHREVLLMQITGANDVDIMLDEDGQPVSDGNGDTALVSDDECWLQDIKNEAMTEEGELFYEDEEGDASYGWSLLDFMQGEYDDFTQMEIQQRIRSKMSKRDYIDAGSIQTTVNFDGHIYHIRIAFRRTDSNSEYNIDIESNGVEVIVE